MRREIRFASPLKRAKEMLDWLLNHKDSDEIPAVEKEKFESEFAELCVQLTPAENEELGRYHDEEQARRWGGSASKH